MVLLLTVFASVGVAILRGGSFRHLARASFRYGWLALLAFGVQVIHIYFPAPRTEGLMSWRALTLLGSYGLLVAVAVLNARLPGMFLIGLGLISNLVVMAVNGGFMPVTLEALQRAGLAHLALGTENGARVMATKDVVLARASTQLWLLSDILVLSKPFPIRTVFSGGDVLLMVGVLVLFQCAMRTRDVLRKHDRSGVGSGAAAPRRPSGNQDGNLSR